MAVRLKVAFILAYITPALEIISCIGTPLKRDDLCKPSKEQGKGTSCADYPDGHIVPVEHKDVTVQRGANLAGNHNQRLPKQLSSLTNLKNLL